METAWAMSAAMGTKKIALIVVPYELGRFRHGVGYGPEHLLERGAESALGTNGAVVRSSVVALDDEYNATGWGEGDAAFELIRLVANEVRRARGKQISDRAVRKLLLGRWNGRGARRGRPGRRVV